jgi:hypothetical protein
MVSLTQVGLVTAKIETTPGVDATPNSTTDFILALNAQYTPDFNVIERNYMRPSISRTPHLMGRQLAKLTFTTEMIGTGVAAATTDVTTQSQATPKWADLLEGCAFSGAAVASPAGKVYTPLTTAQKTLTIYCYYDGILHKLTGAMGTFTMTAKAGEICTIQWTFTGIYNDPTAISTPTPSFPSINPPLVESCSFLIGSTSSTVFVPENIAIDMQNNVVPRDDANSVKGFNSMIITSRNPQSTFNPESVPEASHPFWGDFTGAVGKALSFHIGNVAGNKMLVSLPNVQISNLQYADRNGIRVYDVTAMASSTAGTGNDEVSIKFI